MTATTAGMLFATGLFVGMLALLEAGWRLGGKHRNLSGAQREELSTLETAVFALLGLLIAFTFAHASSRFDTHRQLIIDEANAVRTAYRRVDLTAPESRPQLQALLRHYVDMRLSIYSRIRNTDRAPHMNDTLTTIQDSIWQQAVPAVYASQSPGVASILLTSLTDMFTVSNGRYAGMFIHPPRLIFALLGLVALTCALLAGYGSAGSARSRLHELCFVAAVALTVFVIVELEHPLAGLMRIANFDNLLADVRADMQ